MGRIGSAQSKRRKYVERLRALPRMWARRTSRLVSSPRLCLGRPLALDTHTACLPVAIAYVMQKAPFVFPIVGGRKVEHLMNNLEALDISLTEEHIAFLDNVAPLDRGFPYDVFVRIATSTSSHS